MSLFDFLKTLAKFILLKFKKNLLHEGEVILGSVHKTNKDKNSSNWSETAKEYLVVIEEIKYLK